MTKVLAILLAVSACAAAYKTQHQIVKRAAPDELDCEPQSEPTRWKVECNWCRCRPSGKGLCTMRKCLSASDSGPQCEGPAKWRTTDGWCRCDGGRAICNEATEDENIGKSQLGDNCEPGQSFMKDCNTCMCTNGGAVCTKRKCFSAENIGKSLGGCIPGQSFMKDCNTCLCTNKGQAICTQRACLRGKSLAQPEDLLPVEKTCRFVNADSRWQKNCNWCSCSEDGQPLCTLTPCPLEDDASSLQSKCEGEAEWKDGDGWCKCVDGVAACDAANSGSTFECTEGSSWTEACNTCSCYKNAKLCSKKACIREESLLPVACSPGSSWRRDCNTCSCTSTGRAMCTLKACISIADEEPVAVAKILEVGKDCKAPSGGVARWKNDCNWCSCSSNGVGRCTLLGCITEKEDGPPACEGELFFRHGSQICECIDGQGVCQEEEVLPTIFEEEPVAVAKSLEEGKNCYAPSGGVAGWMKDCNWCDCTSAGVGRCTQRGCLGPKADGPPACEGELFFRHGSQICECIDGQGVCGEEKTLIRVAKEEPLALPKSLEEGKSCYAPSGSDAGWMKGCNWCSCSSNGVGRCTQRGCLDPEVDGPPACEGDILFRRGSQICECIDGHGVCKEEKEKVLPTVPKNEPLPIAKSLLEEGKSCYAPSGGVARWMKGCNWCSCSSNGVGKCTLRGCLGPRADGPPACEGELFFRHGSQICECIDGHGVCKEEKEKVLPTAKSLEEGKSCYAPSGGVARWMKGCNWCSCSSNGVGKCTLRGCLGPRADGPPACEGELFFRHGSQICECIDGQGVCQEEDSLVAADSSPAETQALELAPHQDCIALEGSEAGFEFFCNWCSCSKTGNMLCTLLRCPIDHQPKMNPECKGNVKWRQDDFVCECVNGVGLCTNPVPETGSISLIPRAEQAFQDGKICFAPNGIARWRVECNWCTCGSSGHAICTELGCISGPSDSAPECEGDVVWKSGDEICECVDGAGICGAPEATEEPKLRTALGREKNCYTPSGGVARWKMNCNWCVCTSSGIGKCTLRGCLSSKTEGPPACTGELFFRHGSQICECIDGAGVCHEESLLPTVSGLETETYGRTETTTKYLLNQKEQVCVPSAVAESKWRMGCNWCFCLPSKKVACTLNRCLQGTEQSVSKLLPVCTGQAMWTTGGKSCKCIDNEAHCTDKIIYTNESSSVLEKFPHRVKIDERKSALRVPECEFRTSDDAWKKDCNWCRCGRNGLGLCSKKACLKRQDKIRDQAIECSGQAKWKSDSCNWCSCVDGFGDCTLHSCRSSEDPKRALKDEECIDVKTGSDRKWKVNCNWCSCHDGVKMCTRKKCTKELVVDNESQLIGEKSEVARECNVGSFWIEFCNTCSCMAGKVTCTQNNCASDDNEAVGFLAERMITTYITHLQAMILKGRMTERDQCLSGSSWKKDCNWCKCIGGIEVCSRKVCIANYRTESTELACVSGAEWMNECNVCTCLDGIPFCSNLRCSRESILMPKDNSAKCTRGSRWMDECNWCRCANGNQICSLSVCENAHHMETCSEGSQWRKNDCTWCICNSGRPVCSPVECIINPHEITETLPVAHDDDSVAGGVDECKHHSRTSDGCNWCTCANNILICTQMECIDFDQPEPATNPSATPQSDPNPQSDPAITDERCTDGSSWIDLCNTCICIQGIEVCSGQACAN